jgi:hypothetical protein
VPRIKLTKNKYALISEEDLDLAHLDWYAHESETSCYAARRYTDDTDGKRKREWLHRTVMARILGTPVPSDVLVDHINRDNLDCQRHNLRVATHSQNSINKAKIRGKGKFKGVTWAESHKKWRARIYKEGKIHYLGYYADPVDAANAYDAAAFALFGEFAKLNFERK